jgi:hypothetical protein
MYGKDSDGIGRPVLVESTGKLITTSNLAEAALAGRLFTGTNAALTNTSTTLNTTFVGLALTNPTGSGKLLIVHKFFYAQDIVTTAEAILCLATTTDSGMTAAEMTIYCSRYGYASSVATVRDGGTIVAPVIILPIAGIGDTATTGWTQQPSVVDLNGSIVLAPGRCLCTDTTVAVGAAAMRFGYMWEEVDA